MPRGTGQRILPLRTQRTQRKPETALGGVDINQVTSDVIASAISVHSALGPGLLESAYQVCLAHELRSRGHVVREQLQVPIGYHGAKLEAGYRLDLVVEDTVVVELKAVAKLLPVHEAQVISYLKLSGYPVGLLINFHVPRLRDGLRRFVNDLRDRSRFSPRPPRPPRPQR